jgi:pimeloyl-ACP methyl ester carboxylesterase
MMDARGVGHSQPSLACPEVDALSLDVLAAPTDDPNVRASFLDAVEACYERVAADGIDPSMYSSGSVALDAVDLREALGFDQWIVASHGTASRISFEIARLDPEGVRGLFLDSPDVPEVDPFTEAIEGTRAALAAVSRACEEDPTCAAEMPDLSGSIDETLELLANHDRRPRGCRDGCSCYGRRRRCSLPVSPSTDAV